MSIYIGSDFVSTGGYSVVVGTSPGEIPYDAYIPLVASWSAAHERAEQLRASVEDCRVVFAPIWDPIRYIVFPMLEPHLVLTGTINVYDFAGDLYYDSANSYKHPYGYRVSGGRLTNSHLTGSVERLHSLPNPPDPARWEYIRIDCDMFLVRTK